MKQTVLSILGVFLAFMLVGCFYQQSSNDQHDNQNDPAAVRPVRTTVNGKYLGSEYKGNYVWGGAMNLAWNELGENIIHENPQLKTDEKVVYEMVTTLNHPVFNKEDLDEASYYIKSGYGQKTVDTINKECRQKFPSKSFSDLDIDLGPADIISYAYLLKEVEYATAFEKKDVMFDGQTVKGFYAKGRPQQDTIGIISYENDDRFIVSLKLKDNGDQLILAKGYDMSDPQTVIREIDRSNKGQVDPLGNSDRFEAPMLHLDHHREYQELIGKYLANKGFEEYYIAQMFENIKFDMDEKGARVENEAVIVVPKSAGPGKDQPKNLILDKPYWVIMQRKDSQNPYFILGVKNTELMAN